METAKEIVSVIKFSPKQENLLGEIQGNVEGPESETEDILCPTSRTRWTVHASCFQRILDNYDMSGYEWKSDIVEGSLDAKCK